MHRLKLTWRQAVGALLVAFSAFTVNQLATYVAAQPASGNELSKALQPFVDKKELAGAVLLVADKNKILTVETVGFADIENNTLMGPTTLFWIASQSKPITAAALMLLVDEGKVSLDDPVEKFISEFKDIQFEGRKPKTTITVRHILSHTSGMPFASKAESPTLDKLTLKDAVASYIKTPLQSEPGTKYSYSNAGINTAGRIIEIVSGMPYEKFLDERLLHPLGMKDTTFWPNEEQVKRLAKSYRPNKGKDGLEPTNIGQLKYPLTDRQRQPMPAGGLFSTAPDVAKFCQMMLNGGTFEGKRILSQASVKALTSKQTPAGVPTNYGLGFAVGAGSFGHGGAMATNMNVDTKRGLITVFLVQHAGFPGQGGQSHAAFRMAAERKYGKR